jgi:hypothetical protein
MDWSGSRQHPFLVVFGAASGFNWAVPNIIIGEGVVCSVTVTAVAAAAGLACTAACYKAAVQCRSLQLAASLSCPAALCACCLQANSPTSVHAQFFVVVNLVVKQPLYVGASCLSSKLKICCVPLACAQTPQPPLAGVLRLREQGGEQLDDTACGQQQPARGRLLLLRSAAVTSIMLCMLRCMKC